MDHLLKAKKEYKNFKKQEIQNIFTKTKVICKACFQNDMTYGDFKDLARRSASEKILRDKSFNIAKNPKYDGCQRGLASIVYKFCDKNSRGSGVNNGIKQNKQLAKELHKPIIKEKSLFII